MSEMRAFVALEIGAELRRRIAELAEAVRPSLPPARWVAPPSHHLTLYFLGAIAPAQREKLERRLSAAFAAHQPLELELAAVGSFPPGRPGRVVWLGIEGGNRLAALQKDVARCCELVAERREKRPFHAHVTLARCRRPWRRQAVDALAAALGPLAGSRFGVDHGSLMCSHLGPSGARYETLAALALEGGG